jgi:hypothetical protein
VAESIDLTPLTLRVRLVTALRKLRLASDLPDAEHPRLVRRWRPRLEDLQALGDAELGVDWILGPSASWPRYGLRVAGGRDQRGVDPEQDTAVPINVLESRDFTPLREFHAPARIR